MLSALKALQTALSEGLISESEFAAEREQVMQGKFRKWEVLPNPVLDASASSTHIALGPFKSSFGTFMINSCLAVGSQH